MSKSAYKLETSIINGEINSISTPRYYKNNVKYIHSLYKYFAFNEYNLDALLSSYLYMSDPGNFNDPFDCNYSLTKTGYELSQPKGNVYNAYENAGVISFSQNFLSVLMWAHYTNQYNGYLLEFNLEEKNLFSYQEGDLDFLSAKRVFYNENANPVNLEGINNQELHWFFNFFTKHKCWKYEDEVRIVGLTKNECIRSRYLNFNPEALRSIFIGFKLRQDHIKMKLLENVLSKYSHIKIYEVFPMPNNLELGYEEITL